jgi:short-subunit dehydrogenase
LNKSSECIFDKANTRKVDMDLIVITCASEAIGAKMAAPQDLARSVGGCLVARGPGGLPGRTAYCTTKFAMNGFLEALRTELMADGVSTTTKASLQATAA